MYVPKAFEVRDAAIIDAFIQEHPFISLITVQDEYPIATHLPINAKKVANQWVLEGHLALANPQHLAIQRNSKALAIFMGPHAYISSSVYSHENVPTWNYQAVHARGELQILDDSELDSHLSDLVTFFEKSRHEPLELSSFSADLMQEYKKEIVGFRLRVEKIEAAFKLSQNRNSEDYQAIIEDLEKCPFSRAQEIAQQMKANKPD